MRFTCSDEQYRIFLCYRRKERKPKFAPSEDVAGMLHWWLNYGPRLAVGGPALFEECYQTGGRLTFGETGIEQFMPQMTTCFVVLCPGFFDKMIETYQTAWNEELWMNRDELIEIIRRRLSDRDSGDVCYLELKHALAMNDRVKPVLVTVGGKGPFEGLNKKLLGAILGENSNQLLEPINPCTVDYDQLASYMKGMCWNKISEEDARTLMEKLEKSKEGTALLGGLQQMLCPTGSHEERDTVDTGARLLAELQRCARTFLTLQRPSGEDQYFYASNPKVIYDPIRICNRNESEVKPPFLAHCLVESFQKNKEAFGLQTDDFSYWDVNLDMAATVPEEQQSIPLSVCAVCFGTLSVHHYMRMEWGRLNETPLIESEDNYILRTIRSGQNLLLALRNPYTKTWPSNWEFNADAKTLGIEGTTNQTNLSLATLMSCGFLDSNIPAEFLKPRYEYIRESVEVLLSWGVTWSYDRRITGWRYTPESRNAPALLPTVFVFDTLCKLKQNISKLTSVFTEDDAFHTRLQTDLQRVERTLTEILAFIAVKQCVSIGEPIGAFRRFERTEFSVTHTAYVIKSLCQYMQDYGDENGELQRILTPAIDYLVEEVDKMQQNGQMRFNDFEVFEDFCDSEEENRDDDGLRSTYGEKYEHCAELIVGMALIKIAEYTKDTELRSRVMDQLRWLLDKCWKEKRACSTNGDTVRIRGAQHSLLYPIYALYYYRMFLWDYLLLLEKKEA